MGRVLFLDGFCQIVRVLDQLVLERLREDGSLLLISSRLPSLMGAGLRCCPRLPWATVRR